MIGSIVKGLKNLKKLITIITLSQDEPFFKVKFNYSILNFSQENSAYPVISKIKISSIDKNDTFVEIIRVIQLH